MGLSFLPAEIKTALAHLNYNFLSELRIRKGQPLVAEYAGKYVLIGAYGVVNGPRDAIFVKDVAEILRAATGGSVYNYTEQLKNGFITVEHGVRIGVAGEYVTENGGINTVKNPTSLNVRIPHEITGCSKQICESLFSREIAPTLIFSRPGLGKTTMLRDIAKHLSEKSFKNILVLDERNEIGAMDAYGEGFDLGRADVIRCHNKLHAMAGAIRAMKPDVIITDELYGEVDINAVRYAADCGIAVIASSHVTDRQFLKSLPFVNFIGLKNVGEYSVYDKDFNIVGNYRVDDVCGSISVG